MVVWRDYLWQHINSRGVVVVVNGVWRLNCRRRCLQGCVSAAAVSRCASVQHLRALLLLRFYGVAVCLTDRWLRHQPNQRQCSQLVQACILSGNQAMQAAPLRAYLAA
jgi:hypothetical protein